MTNFRISSQLDRNNLSVEYEQNLPSLSGPLFLLNLLSTKSPTLHQMACMPWRWLPWDRWRRVMGHDMVQLTSSKCLIALARVWRHLARAWRHLARAAARDGFLTLARSGPLCRVCQISNFQNRTSISRDTANFVKPCFFPKFSPILGQTKCCVSTNPTQPIPFNLYQTYFKWLAPGIWQKVHALTIIL